MQSPAAARPRTPYGLSFPLHELVFVRDWAVRQSATLAVKLDQVLDGAEFEELLLISPHGKTRTALTLWRTDHSIIAQVAGGHPKGFASVQIALAHFAAALSAAPATGGKLSRWKKLLTRF